MSALRTTGDPIAVQQGTVVTALELLGVYDWRDIVDVVIGPRKITVKRLRRNENGEFVAAGSEAATTTNVIAVRKEPS